MIQLGGETYALTDPAMLLLIGGGGVVLLVLILLVMAVRAAGRSARVAAPLARQMQILGGHVQQLGMGQEQLRGGLQTVSDTQANAQAQMVQSIEARMAHVQQQMQDHGHWVYQMSNRLKLFIFLIHQCMLTLQDLVLLILKTTLY